MSYTGAYSRIYRLDENNDPEHRAPKILDMDDFRVTAEEIEVQCGIDADTVESKAVLKERADRTEYPEKTYKHLWGFKSWTPADCFGLTNYNDPHEFDSVTELFSKIQEVLDQHRQQYSTGGLGYNCNIERFAIPYGTMPEKIARFFALLSTATEPFVVWHADKENDMPDLGRMDANGIEEETVYRIECRGGEATIYEVTYRRDGEEKLCEVEEPEAFGAKGGDE